MSYSFEDLLTGPRWNTTPEIVKAALKSCPPWYSRLLLYISLLILFQSIFAFFLKDGWGIGAIPSLVFAHVLEKRNWLANFYYACSLYHLDNRNIEFEAINERLVQLVDSKQKAG